MEYYRLYDSREKRSYTTTADWWALITFIKHNVLENQLQRDINKSDWEWCYGSSLIVMTELGERVSYDEVKRALSEINVNNDKRRRSRDDEGDTYSAEYRDPMCRYDYKGNAYGHFLFRYTPIPDIGKSGNRCQKYRKIKFNKKYWADLSEFEVGKSHILWVSPWYDEISYRPKDRSWKRCVKKKRQWM